MIGFMTALDRAGYMIALDGVTLGYGAAGAARLSARDPAG